MSSCSEHIDLPVLKYGYRTTRLDWPELVHIITEERNLDKLTRSEDDQRNYMIYMKRIKREWKSVADYVLCDKFDLKRLQDDSTGLWFAHPPLSEISGVHTRVVQNDFPYYFTPHIEHWILWKLGGDCEESDIASAKMELQKRLGDVQDFSHWTNPPHLKSLPEMDHVHILVRRHY